MVYYSHLLQFVFCTLKLLSRMSSRGATLIKALITAWIISDAVSFISFFLVPFFIYINLPFLLPANRLIITETIKGKVKLIG